MGERRERRFCASREAPYSKRTRARERGPPVTPKVLRGWEDQFHKACVLACLYQCSLTLDQFCASNGLEPEDREVLLDHFETVGIGV